METAEESRNLVIEQKEPYKEGKKRMTEDNKTDERIKEQGKDRLNSESNDGDIDNEEQEMLHKLPKGYHMMSKMGYKIGDTLGSEESKDYNHDTRLKRPLDLHWNPPNVKRKSTTGNNENLEEEYRQFNSQQQSEKRKIDIWRNMQKIAFEMSGDVDLCLPGSDPRDFNILWRPYVREINGWQRQVPLVEEPPDDEQSTSDALTKENPLASHDQASQHHSIEIESIPDNYSDCEDEELNLLYEMNLDDRIIKLHIFLQCELYYCYYCGVQFEDESDLHANCPGLTEDEH